MGPKFSTKGLAGLSHLPHNRRLSLFHFLQTSTEKGFDLFEKVNFDSLATFDIQKPSE